MFGLITVTVGIVLVGYLIVKKYYAPWALLLVGLLMLLAVGLFTNVPLVTGKKVTHSMLLDVVQVVTNLSSSTLAGLGLQIMVISGLADYLDKIGIKLIARTIMNIIIPRVLVILLRIASLVLPSFFP